MGRESSVNVQGSIHQSQVRNKAQLTTAGLAGNLRSTCKDSQSELSARYLAILSTLVTGRRDWQLLEPPQHGPSGPLQSSLCPNTCPNLLSPNPDALLQHLTLLTIPPSLGFSGPVLFLFKLPLFLDPTNTACFIVPQVFHSKVHL